MSDELADSIPVADTPETRSIIGEVDSPVDFGLGYSVPQPADIETRLELPAAVARDLTQQISQHVTREIAQSAVAADAMNLQIGQQIQGELAIVASRLANLQAPIEQEIVNDFSATLEATLPMGVIPPLPSIPSADPRCVQVRTEFSEKISRTVIPDLRTAYESDGCRTGSAVVELSQFYEKCAGDVFDFQATLTEWLKLAGESCIAPPPALSAAAPAPAAPLAAVAGGGATVWPESGGLKGEFATINGASNASGGCEWAWHFSDQDIPYSGVRGVYVGPRSLPRFATDVISQVDLFGNGSTGGISDADLASISAAVNPGSFATVIGFIPELRAGNYVRFSAWLWANGCRGVAPAAASYTPPSSPPSPGTIPIPLPPDGDSSGGTCPPTDKTGCRYRVWRTAGDDGVCYVLPEKVPPKARTDELIADGEFGDGMLQRAIDSCRGGRPEPRELVDPNIMPREILGCAEFGTVPTDARATGLAMLPEILGLLDRTGKLPEWLKSVSIGSPMGVIAELWLGSFNGVVKQILTGLDAVLRQSPCADGQQVSLMTMDALYGFASMFLGTSLDQLRIPNAQQKNFRCPVVLPDYKEATNAWLANEISEDTLRCWVRACSKRDEEWMTVANASRSKLTPLQIGSLWLRQYLSDGEYRERLRELGFIRDSDPDDLQELLKQIPPAGDLVRFMVRDADDELNIDWGPSDQLFFSKFGPRMKEWADSQGIDETYMQYVWRAHWQLPSPTALYEMLHRLSRLDPSDPRYVDAGKVRTALLQNDMEPGWVDRMMAISYSPLTRVDAQRAYRIGVLGWDQLRDAYLDLGYDVPQATTLADFSRQQKLIAATKRPEVRQLAAGELSLAEFDASLTQQGFDGEAKAAAAERSKILGSQLRRKRCVAALRRRYLVAEFDQPDAVRALTSFGVPHELAENIAAGWECERSARGKEFSASQLCEFYDAGFIDEMDFVNRSQRLGWSYDDSIVLLRACQRRLGIRDTKRQAAELARLQREREKLARQIKAEAKEKEATARRMAAEGRRLQSLAELRNRRLLEAAGNLAKNWDADFSDQVYFVKGIYRALEGSVTNTRDEIIASLLSASRQKNIADQASYQDEVSSILANESAEESGEEVEEPEESPTAGNGHATS